MAYSVSGGEDHRPRGVFWREPVRADTRADARARVEVAPAQAARLGGVELQLLADRLQQELLVAEHPHPRAAS